LYDYSYARRKDGLGTKKEKERLARDCSLQMNNFGNTLGKQVKIDVGTSPGTSKGPIMY
jgi:hypothetical protein